MHVSCILCQFVSNHSQSMVIIFPNFIISWSLKWIDGNLIFKYYEEDVIQNSIRTVAPNKFKIESWCNYWHMN
jgi:hypothetical protein